jgi:hypothetical protein
MRDHQLYDNPSPFMIKVTDNIFEIMGEVADVVNVIILFKIKFLLFVCLAPCKITYNNLVWSFFTLLSFFNLG